MRGKLIQLKKILGRNSGLYESEMEKARQNWIQDRQSEENLGLDLGFVLNCQERKRMKRIGENLSRWRVLELVSGKVVRWLLGFQMKRRIL